MYSSLYDYLVKHIIAAIFLAPVATLWVLFVEYYLDPYLKNLIKKYKEGKK